MTAKPVNGSGNGARSGAQTLVLLAAPLNVLLLRALSEGSKGQAELRSETGSPAQTTLRAQLKRLVEVGALEKHRRNRFPGVLEYELTASGRGLLFVAVVLERWLAKSPGGALTLESNAARAATKAIAAGWSTTMLRALAARAFSLTELDGIIGSLSYPSLERRLGAMRLAGLIQPKPGNGPGTPYALTDWARQGMAPLTAASRWEQRHLGATSAPIARLDAEALFLLAMPLLRLLDEESGSCRMAMEIPGSNGQRLAGVTVSVENGTIASCVTQLRGSAGAWALGTPVAWLSALVEEDSRSLELGGDCALARGLTGGLHRSLFGLPLDKPS